MFLLICKLYICIQNVFGHIFYSSRLHLYWQFWQFEVQKLAYMLILAAGGMIPYLSSVGGQSGTWTCFWIQQLTRQHLANSGEAQLKESPCIIKHLLADKAMLVEDEEPHADEDGVEFAPLTMNCDIGIQKLFSEKVRSD